MLWNEGWRSVKVVVGEIRLGRSEGVVLKGLVCQGYGDSIAVVCQMV